MREDLPTGTVTFLFTDIEGSTRLLHSLGAVGEPHAEASLRDARGLFASMAYAPALAEVDALLRQYETAAL